MNAIDSQQPLSGDELREVLHQAALHLRANRAHLNAINVYPVPDGDTGSNMAATFDEAMAGVEKLPPGVGAGEVFATLAKAALYGARGNSGVIMSQAVRGLAEGTKDLGSLDGARLARGLAAAAERAYGAVAEPREGTMLTVLREAAEAATEFAKGLPDGGEGQGAVNVLEAAIERAEAAEAATIDQLPQLREAGVTDSGGEGICVILRGIRAGILGEPAPAEDVASDSSSARVFAESHQGEDFGYCVEFLVANDEAPIDLEQIRAALQASDCTSVVVVGDETTARIHVHALDAGAPVTVAERFGTTSRLKVDDMGEQAARLAEGEVAPTARVAVLALSAGAGFDRAFRDFGARIAELGSLMKPSAGDIARAADALHVPDVIVLPNHENVLLSAEQAREISRCELHVVPTKTMPQGLAALLSYDLEASLEENLRQMGESMTSVATVEVTQATTSRTADDVAVQEGEFIALADGKLVASREGAIEALLAGVTAVAPESASLATVFVGDETTVSGDELERELSKGLPGLEVEIVDGGQPLYLFIASIE